MQSNEPFTNNESVFDNDNDCKQQVQRPEWQYEENVEAPLCKFNELNNIGDNISNTCCTNHWSSSVNYDATDKLAFRAVHQISTEASNCFISKKQTPLEPGKVDANVYYPESKSDEEQILKENSLTNKYEEKCSECAHQEKLCEPIFQKDLQREMLERQMEENNNTVSVNHEEETNYLSSEEQFTEDEDEEEIVEFHHHNWFVSYLKRLKGAGEPGPPWFSWSKDAIPSFIFSTLTLLILTVIYVFGLDKYNLGLSSFLPSFGASCTLVMYLSTTPGAQPRALISTHVLGAFLGVSFSHITKSLPTPLNQQLASAFGVSLLTSWMMLTGTLQPSASATTCLAAFHLYGVMHDQGFMFLITPALIGPVIVVFMGWLLNNLIPWRRPYPV